MTPEHTRRGALAVGALAAVTLTACDDSNGTGDDNGGGYGAPKPQQPKRRRPDTPPLADLDDIPVGEAIKTQDADGQQLIVARPADREVAAFSATCTHLGCTVEPAGPELRCPCHGSTFDTLTGEVRNGPAERPLPARPVRLREDRIFPA